MDCQKDLERLKVLLRGYVRASQLEFYQARHDAVMEVWQKIFDTGLYCREGVDRIVGEAVGYSQYTIKRIRLYHQDEGYAKRYNINRLEH